MTMDRHDILSPKLGDYVLGDVTPEEIREIEGHVRDCAECAAELGELSLVMEGLARVPEPVTPPPALKRRVLESIASLPKAGQTVDTARRGWNPGWLAAAAAMILALGGALYL
nr:zf-HC2 domain-containing protein [Acidobacteriota bacterium]